MSYEDAARAVENDLSLAAQDWSTADYIADDELKGMLRERPPFGTETHRLLSTILKLRGL